MWLVAEIVSLLDRQHKGRQNNCAIHKWNRFHLEKTNELVRVVWLIVLVFFFLFCPYQKSGFKYFQIDNVVYSFHEAMTTTTKNAYCFISAALICYYHLNGWRIEFEPVCVEECYGKSQKVILWWIWKNASSIPNLAIVCQVNENWEFQFKLILQLEFNYDTTILSTFFVYTPPPSFTTHFLCSVFVVIFVLFLVGCYLDIHYLPINTKAGNFFCSGCVVKKKKKCKWDENRMRLRFWY